jgi:hypothetical protein
MRDYNINNSSRFKELGGYITLVSNAMDSQLVTICVIMGVIGILRHFFGFLGACAGGLCRTVRCNHVLGRFVWLPMIHCSCISEATLAQLFGCLQTHL